VDERAVRALLEHYWSNADNPAVAHENYREDAVLEFPQSGERFVGLANIRGFREVFPADVAFSIVRIRGGGDLWVAEGTIACDGGTPLRGVTIMEFRDGAVVHETIYVGEPWEPPAWRAPWREAGADADADADAGAGPSEDDRPGTAS